MASILSLLLSVLQVVSVAASSKVSIAHADDPAGTGGDFQALQARLVDTRNGTGGFSTPLTAGQARSYAVEGQVGVPASGVSAVAVSVLVIGPAAGGYLSVTADPKPDGSGTATALTWAAGETISNSALVAVGSNGHILLTASVATNVVIDVEGYFTDGNGKPAAGGYVPVTPTRILSTPTGVGAPQAQVASHATVTVQASGVAGVPSGASALFANVDVLNETAAGYITAYPGGTPPSTSEDYLGSGQTSFGLEVPLSASGSFTIYNGGSSAIDLTADVSGYFAATKNDAVFTAWQTRVYDSRPSNSLASGATTSVQVAGMNQLPATGQGLGSVAISFQGIEPSGGNGGYLRAWPSDQSEPTGTSTITMSAGEVRTNLGVLQVGADGTIKIHNVSSVTVNFVLDVDGWFATTTALPPATGPICTSSGQRSGDQPMKHGLTDQSQMQYNPVNGNLLLTGTLLHLKGVGQDVSITWRYNGLNDARPTLSTGLFEAALQPWSDGSYTYVAPDGGCYKFSKSGSTWTTPAGVNATLTSVNSTTMRLRFNAGGIKNTYVQTNGVWALTTSADKNSSNPNTISYTYSGNTLASITDTQGRSVTFAYTDPNNATQPSTITDTSLNRTISLSYAQYTGQLSTVTDATGAVTTLTYDSTGLRSSTDGESRKTTFTYDAQQRLSAWTFGAGTGQSAGWAATYPSSTSTVLTDPDGDNSTYTLTKVNDDTSSKDHYVVSKVLDALGHGTTANTDSHDDTTTQLDATAQTSTMAYGNGTGNPNNMLSKVTSPTSGSSGTGASMSLSYPATSTGNLTDYQPSASTDGQGNKTSMTWDANTNQLSDSSTTNAAGNSVGGHHTATYQGDSHSTDCGAKAGEMCTNTSENGHVTTYGYDTNGNLTSITPPSPLGQRTYSYDAAGRVSTATDGRGNIAHYRYDDDDRILRISYTSPGCATGTCVVYGYDKSGNRTSRTDNTGTTTSWTYDPLNRVSTESLGSTTVASTTYDGANNMLTFTDAGGTTTYKYDAGNNLIKLAEPGGTCPTGVTTPNSTGCTIFSYDNDNRRTVTSFPTGQNSTVGYDYAGKIKSVTAANSGGTTLVSRAYTYKSGAGSTDQDIVDTMKDEAGGSTTYNYDGKNRLTSTTGTDAGTWNYDNDGNRTSWTAGGSTTYAAYNNADELCWTASTSGSSCTSPPAGATTVSSDTTGDQSTDTTSAGNLTDTYNVFNELTQTAVNRGASTAFTYPDADATSRASVTTGAAATSYTNGILGVTGQTNTPSGASLTFVRDPSGTLIAMQTGGASYYYTQDALGSVIAITDPNQTLAAKYHYTPWGATTTATGTMAATNPYRYATGYTDPTTGYLKLGARYYNPSTGRFTQPDPNATWGGYTYADNDPKNVIDPTGRCGLDSWDDVGDCFSSIASTASCVGNALSPLGAADAGSLISAGIDAIGWGALLVAGGLASGGLGIPALGIPGLTSIAAGGFLLYEGGQQIADECF